MTNFTDFELNEVILKNLEEMGYETATDVQAESINPILQKKDVVMNSHTGSGKTGAFLIPFIQNTRLDIPAVQYIILVPTRELASQVKNEAERIAKGTGVKVACIYGGMSYQTQVKAIKEGAQIVVGTPGRMLDHLKRRTLSLSVVRGLVLDEGDKMLSMGFLPEVRLILDYLPKRHQTILSSATFPPAIEQIIEHYMLEPKRISLVTQEQTAKEISHYYCLVSMDEKEKALLSFLEQEEPTLSLIFCNTKVDVASVYQFLKHAGLNAAALSSDLPQKQREEILHDLRVGQITHLVCTDLAARGLDIPHLSHVFIFAAGEDLETYVHRTGRTGRAGRAGKAISIVSGQDIANFNMALKVHGIEAKEIVLPTDEEVANSRSKNYFKQLKDIAFAKDADVHEEFADIAKKLEKEQVDSLLPFLLERFFKFPKIPQWNRKESIPLPASSESETKMESREPRESREYREPRESRETRENRRPQKRPAGNFQGETMCIGLGSSDGLDDHTLKTLLGKQGNIRPHQLGRIEIHEYESFFEIQKMALKYLRRVNGKHYRQHEILLDKSPVPFDKVEKYRALSAHEVTT